jgi:dolichol-phosphate mannosyltransferase
MVIPAFNEGKTVGDVVRDARKSGVLSGIIVVDDGSTDGTWREARKAGATVLRHGKNMGVGAALRTGFTRARRQGCETIVVMGADAQDLGRQIPRLLGGISSGYDFVQGSRWLKGGRTENMPLARKIGTHVYSALFSLVVGRRLTDATNGFRAFRASMLDRIDLRPRWLNRYELEPYLYLQALRRGFRVKEVPVTKRFPGPGGSYTKMTPFLDWWRILRPLLLLKFGIRK